MTGEQRAVRTTDPYPGPRPFTTEESTIFKGRDRESRDVRDLLLSYQAVVLYSKSGSGKSSLVNAALLPMLAEEGLEILPVARVSGKVPPLVDGAAIGNIYAFNVLSNCSTSNAGSTSLLKAQLTELVKEPLNKPRLLVLDQFEELFTTFPERWQDRRPFFVQLQRLCELNKELRVLFVIREDHVAELDPYADLLPNGLRIRYRLERLREEPALQAILVPMHLAGYSFEEGVAESIAANLRRIHVDTDDGVKEVTGEFIEPLHLQLVCRNLWTNFPKGRSSVTAADVQKFADVNEALGSFYKGAVALAATQARFNEGRIRTWVEKGLITPGGTRGLVYMGKTETGGVPNEAVRVLEQEHLVWAESRGGTLWYELTHDRLIAPVKASNRAWFAKHRRSKRVVVLLVICAAVVALNIMTYHYLKGRSRRAHALQDEEAYTRFSTGKEASREKNWDRAVEEYTSALSLYVRLEDRDRQAQVYRWLGSAYSNKGQKADAISAYQEALRLHEGLADKEAAADDRISIAHELFPGDNRRAIEYFSQAAAQYQELELPLKRANAIREIGNAYRWLDDYDNAEHYLGESIDLYEHLKEPNPGEEALAKSKLGALFADQGKYASAATLHQQVIGTLLENGKTSDALTAIVNLGLVQFYQGKSAEAMRQYKRALAEYRRVDDKPGMCDVWVRMATWYEASHACEKSIEYADRAFATASEVHSDLEVMMARRVRARAYLCAHSLEKAGSDVAEALQDSTKAGDRWSQAFNLETLALIAEAKGDLPSAVENGQKAVETYNSISANTIYAKQARANLARCKSRLVP